MASDNVCKFLAETYPNDLAFWLLGDMDFSASLWEPLKTELAVEPIRADSIIILQKADILLHVEFQTLPQSQPELPFRMVDYYIRLKRLYPQSKIHQALIFLKPTTDLRCLISHYQDAQLTHQFQVIRMWEQDPGPFLKNPGLLPLATLCQTDDGQELLETIATEVNQMPPEIGRAQLLACCDVLAGLRFEKELIQRIFREDLMQESVTYQDILQKGVERGLKQGIEQGLQRGLLRGEATVVIRLLQRRFGDLSPAVVTQIQNLPLAKLEELADALLDFRSLSDLMLWLADEAAISK